MIMNAYLTYGIIFVILLALELCYFKVADHFNIIDKRNSVFVRRQPIWSIRSGLC